MSYREGIERRIRDIINQSPSEDAVVSELLGLFVNETKRSFVNGLKAKKKNAA